MLVTKPSEQVDKSLYSETSPFGHLYSKDTSIQGTQNVGMWSRKNVHVILTLLKGQSGLERDTFSGSPGFDLHSENTFN